MLLLFAGTLRGSLNRLVFDQSDTSLVMVGISYLGQISMADKALPVVVPSTEAVIQTLSRFFVAYL